MYNYNILLFHKHSELVKQIGVSSGKNGVKHEPKLELQKIILSIQ